MDDTLSHPFELFDTDEHRAQQERCHCVIHCAVDGHTRQRVCEALDYARRVNDAMAVPILLAQLTGPCTMPGAEAD